MIAHSSSAARWVLTACLLPLAVTPVLSCTSDVECMGFGDRCRTPSFCVAGECTATTPVDCNDRNPCTIDGCENNRGGCFHDPYCPADAAVCNGTEVCNVVIISIDPPMRGPACAHADVPQCDDRKACTNDFCAEPGGCAHTAVNCDDGNVCTVDACVEPGGCSRTPRDCDDDDPCTTDDCLPGAGCRHTPVAACCRSVADCPDLACSVERACVAGSCTAGVPRRCDDGNPTTVDGCDPRAGCTHVPLAGGGTAGCTDADDCAADRDPCTSAACVNGTCAQQSLGGLAGLVCACTRPRPDACGTQAAPRPVARAERRACNMIGRLPNANGARAAKLVRRVARQFDRAQRAALGASGGRKPSLTPPCAAALGTIYGDNVARARRLEERK